MLIEVLTEPKREVFSLEVSETTTVYQLKRKIEKKLGIAPNTQILKNEVGMSDNDKTLAEYNVHEGTTLVLSIKETITVQIRKADGYSINVEVSPSDTVRDLKEKIEVQENVRFGWQILELEGFYNLEDRKKLSEYYVVEWSIIHLTLTKMVITIQHPRKTTDIEVSPSDTVLSVKQRVEETDGIPFTGQKLVFHAAELDDKSKLGECKITHASIILLRLKKIKLSIVQKEGDDINIEIFPSTVKSIKQAVNLKKKIPLEDQNLFLKNQMLEDDKQLSDYKIQSGEQIRLIIKTINIEIKAAFGKNFQYKGRRSSTIKSMKQELEKKEGMKLAWQMVKFEESDYLSDSKKIGELNLVDGSIIHLTLKKMTIYIQKDKKIISQEVSPSDTILSVKKKLEKTDFIPFTCQILNSPGSEMKDDSALNDYEITHKSTIHLEVQFIKLGIYLEDRQNKDVELYPSTVKNLKQTISSMINIPVKDQKLSFENDLLKDDKQLTGYKLQTGDTIKLVIKVINIQIQKDSGQILQYSVHPLDTVKELKQQIESQEDINTDWQVLQFADSHDLEVSKKLYEYKVLDGSVIHLTLTAMIINIQQDEKNITLQVAPSDTVLSVKQRIEEIESIPFSCQSINCLGSEMLDDSPLSDYKIMHKATLQLKLQMIQLSISLEDGEDINVELYPSAVKNLKETIFSKLKVAVEDQLLSFHQDLLQDHNQLGDYKIQRGNTIKLVIKEINIQIETEYGQLSVYEVHPLDTIGVLKKKIESREDMKIHWQVLKFEDSADLKEGLKLYEYNIVDGSVIHLTLTAMMINIQKDEHKLCLQVTPSDSVLSIKQRVEESEGIPFSYQSLSYGDSDLADNSTLSDCKIMHQSLLLLTLKMIQLNIMRDNGEPIKVELYPSTVKCLKEAIYTEANIPAEDQDMYYNDNCLKDDHKLSDYKIQSGFSINLVIQKINIQIKTEKQQMIQLEAFPSNTILDIKKNVEDKEGIPFTYQSLSYEDTEYEDNLKLHDCKITDNSTLYLRLQLIQLTIIKENGDIIQLELLPDTIKSLKQAISSEADIPEEDQVLYYDQKVLQDDNQLSEYKIQSGSKIYLVIQKIKIQICSEKGDTYYLDVIPSNTVLSVKHIVEETKGIPFTYQTLWYQDDALEDNSKLSDYKIEHESTLNLKIQMIQLGITLENGKHIDVECFPFTVKGLKETICPAVNIPVEDQDLCYESESLQDDKQLGDYKIQSGSDVKLVIKVMNIQIITEAGQDFYYKVRPSDTVESVKQYIEEKEGVQVNYQKLHFNGVDLDGNHRFYEHNNIQDGSTLKVIYEQLNLTIKDADEECLKVKIYPSDTVRDLKTKIQEWKNMHPDYQTLTHSDGQELDDNNTLDYYKNLHNSTLKLIGEPVVVQFANVQVPKNVIKQIKEKKKEIKENVEPENIRSDSKLMKDMVLAAKGNDFSKVECILKVKPHFINGIPVERAWSALHQAAHQKNVDAVKMLLSFEYCDVNVRAKKDRAGITLEGEKPRELTSSREIIQLLNGRKASPFVVVPTFVAEKLGDIYIKEGIPLFLMSPAFLDETIAFELKHPKNFLDFTHNFYALVRKHWEKMKVSVAESLYLFSHDLYERVLKTDTFSDFAETITYIYTSPHVYHQVNTALRRSSEKLNPTGDDYLLCLYAFILETLLLYFDFPAYNGKTYRGAQLTSDQVAKYRQGTTFVWMSFTSSSKVKNGSFSGNVKFIFDNDCNSEWKPRDISRCSQFPGEAEMLYPAGAKFKVTRVDNPLFVNSDIHLKLQE